MQDALARAYRSWSRIRADDPDAYLRTAVTRTYVSWWRRRSSHELVRALVHEPADRVRWPGGHGPAGRRGGPAPRRRYDRR